MSIVQVFAYGSKLCLERIQARAPSARRLAVASLPRYSLRFHKVGRDGSAKADAFYTGLPEDEVWGVVYALADIEKSLLDHLSEGYVEREVTVATHSGRSTRVITHVAPPVNIDPSLRPYTWYKELVLAGARDHGLPEGYCLAIEAVKAVEDPDFGRHCRELGVLAARAAGSSAYLEPERR